MRPTFLPMKPGSFFSFGTMSFESSSLGILSSLSSGFGVGLSSSPPSSGLGVGSGFITSGSTISGLSLKIEISPYIGLYNSDSLSYYCKSAVELGFFGAIPICNLV